MEAEAVRPKPFSLPRILSAVVQPDRMSVMSMPGVASVWSDAVEYWIDAARRTILYWDVMRQRGNHYHEQQKRAALTGCGKSLKRTPAAQFQYFMAAQGDIIFPAGHDS